MIFKQYRQIVGLEQPLKTETRRIVKDNEGCAYAPDGSISEVGYIPKNGGTWRRKWFIGQRLPIMTGRGKPALWRAKGRDAHTHEPVMMFAIGPIPGAPNSSERCYVTVTALDRQCLQAIDTPSAIREGVSDEIAYRDLFQSINGPNSWTANPDVWVVTFKYD